MYYKLVHNHSKPVLCLQVNSDDDSYQRMLELWFLFCLIWSIGASVDEDSRKKMDTFIRELEGQFPAKVGTCTWWLSHLNYM